MTNQHSTTTALIEQADEAIAATLGDDWPDLDDETKAALVRAEGDLRSAIALLEEARDRLKPILLTAPRGPENAEAIGGFKVFVKQGATLDKAGFAARYPADSNPVFYKQEPDLAAIKRSFAPADLERFYKPSAPSVDFKAA